MDSYDVSVSARLTANRSGTTYHQIYVLDGNFLHRHVQNIITQFIWQLLRYITDLYAATANLVAPCRGTKTEFGINCFMSVLCKNNTLILVTVLENVVHVPIFY